ncbi:MAG: DUF1559 domain-containing protein [Planctomycetaceae bacterium]
MNESPPTTEGEKTAPAPPKKWYQFTVIEWVVVVAIIAVVIALFWPTVQFRGIDRGSTCKNNLKQIGLALHNYHDAHGSFPPAYLADEHGRPMHSWRVLILPFMDHHKLYDEYRFDEPWNGPHNITLQDRIPEGYRCPTYQRQLQERKTDSEFSQRLTNYVVIESPTAVFDGTHAPTISEITDGTDKTILVVDVNQHAVHWMQPDEITPDDFFNELRFAADGKRALHPMGLQVLMADGAVRYISSTTPIKTVLALITKAGGETVGDF